MTTHCFAPVLGKRIRVTRLDNCGVAPEADVEDAWLATDGFVSVALSVETEDGNEIIKRNAQGFLCINEKQANSLKRLNVDIEFCGVNPSLLAMVSNANPYADYSGDIAGITVPEGTIDKKFAIELWTGLSGQACAEGAEDASGYLVLPFVVAGVLGDVEFNGEDAATFAITGAYTKGGNAWGRGPYNALLDEGGTAAPLPTPLDPLDHLLLIDTGLAPPPSACDPQPMPTPPATVPATGATAGTPGTWTPSGSAAPQNLAATAGLTADPTTAWSAGQYVVLGDASHAHWNGTAWAAGDAAALAADDQGNEQDQPSDDQV